MNSDSKSNIPLAGLNVLVTRPEHQAAALANPLKALGANVVTEPAIEILPPASWAELDRAIKNIAEGRVSTLVFVSVNGVRVFLDRISHSAQAANLAEIFADIKAIGIGKATCKALEDRGMRARNPPGKSDSNSVADFLIAFLNAQQPEQETLIIRADRGSNVLPDRLNVAQIQFQQIVAYRSVDRQTVSDASIRAMKAGEIDWVTVTSSAIATSLARLFGDALHHAKLASISPTTSQSLRELGFSPDAEASEYHMAGIVEAITAYEAGP